jgi:uncharacterized protein YbjT (DUF2867 family)
VRVVLAGATGLVGGLILDQLNISDDVTSVYTLARRAMSVAAPKQTSIVGDIADWPCMMADCQPDLALCTLGTTLRQAGSQEAFFAVDHDAVIAFARAARGAGARRFMMVSSIGAHPGSRNFYLSVKGKAEQGVQSVGFDRVDIFRPGLLRGHRAGPVRIGERFATLISPLTDVLTPFVLDHYRSIEAKDVGRAMCAAMALTEAGVYAHDNRAMLALLK